MMNELLVNLQKVSRVYMQGKTPVKPIDEVTCSIYSGDRIALTGPSGSGKSTLLHVIGGIDDPTSGHVSWPAMGGKKELRPERIGFVFQTTSLLGPLSVIENVELPLLLTGVNPKDARNRALRTLSEIGLDSLSEKLPEELSGGQAQRIALARALTVKPRVILADEPTGQLDHPTADRLFDYLLAALAPTETALVVATHDPTVTRRLEKVWHIQEGKLEVHT